MASSRLIHRLATNPRMMMKFQATGRSPREFEPKSPLIDLLESIDWRERRRMLGVTVDETLGYTNAGRFGSAEQLLVWLKPKQRMIEGETWPAESHRIKWFAGPLRLSVLLDRCVVVPEGIAERYPRL